MKLEKINIPNLKNNFIRHILQLRNISILNSSLITSDHSSFIHDVYWIASYFFFDLNNRI